MEEKEINEKQKRISKIFSINDHEMLHIRPNYSMGNIYTNILFLSLKFIIHMTTYSGENIQYNKLGLSLI